MRIFIFLLFLCCIGCGEITVPEPEINTFEKIDTSSWQKMKSHRPGTLLRHVDNPDLIFILQLSSRVKPGLVKVSTIEGAVIFIDYRLLELVE